MSTPNGYNNPAYCHQFDSSLYDYHCVPKIDPDEESQEKENHRKSGHPKLVSIQREHSESEEFEGSDESNQSIIIEECNNRKVTLICEKRNKTEVHKDEFYEDENFRGAYYQDVSLESEKEFGVNYGRRTEEKSLRHQRPLEPPLKQSYYIRASINGSNNNDKRLLKTATLTDNYPNVQRFHRYEEIPSAQDNESNSPSIHRYAEITSDENGYPTLAKEIKIRENNADHLLTNNQNYSVKTIPKSRAPSPVDSNILSSSPRPSNFYHRNPESKDFYQSTFNSSSPFIYSSSPIKTNTFEMAELSPPRFLDNSNYMGNNYTLFMYSPKRQPPVGASSATESQGFNPPIERCIFPKNLQQFSAKPVKGRCHSLPNTPKKNKVQETLSSQKTEPQRKSLLTFNAKSVKPNQTKPKPKGKYLNDKENNPCRRNILSSFMEPPKESRVSISQRSPYKSTTTEIIPPNTAVVTPIFQRKNQEGFDENFTIRRNLGKMSQAYQSTSNIFRSTKDQAHLGGTDFRFQGELMSPARIKRNQSVPNFSQTLAVESRMLARRNHESSPQEQQKYSRNLLHLQCSPKKAVEPIPSINKSRLSLLNQSKSSWSVLENHLQPQCAGCFIFATIVHLVTATATCAITFYLLSKVGRKYYLDFGLLAGFVNFILGLLGFRSYCWRWLPNRNYVSGFIGLAAFSALTCAGLTYLIIARPMAGDPMLDVLGGAICAVSVLTIALSLTGLTMSGCCKAPPPDNRVTDI